jgi:hypothetical protein
VQEQEIRRISEIGIACELSSNNAVFVSDSPVLDGSGNPLLNQDGHCKPHYELFAAVRHKAS